MYTGSEGTAPVNNLDRVVTVMNGKGGVGKTSLVGNVAALLAAMGHRILVADLDPQGNLAEELGYSGTSIDDLGEGLASAIQYGRTAIPQSSSRERLDILAGGEYLEEVEQVLAARTGVNQSRRAPAHQALAQILDPIAGEYDLVLIDTPPVSPALQEAALGAARWLVVPTKSDESSRKGLLKVARRYTHARTRGASVDLLGVVMFGIGSQAAAVRERTRTALVEDLDEVAPVFDTVIRDVEATAETARRRGMAVFELEDVKAHEKPWWERVGEGAAIPSSVVGLAADYYNLTREILDRVALMEAADPAELAAEDAS